MDCSFLCWVATLTLTIISHKKVQSCATRGTIYHGVSLTNIVAKSSDLCNNLCNTGEVHTIHKLLQKEGNTIVLLGKASEGTLSKMYGMIRSILRLWYLCATIVAKRT